MAAAKLSPPYAIRRSPTHGRGAFATRTIRKGARIIEYRGTRLAPAVADTRPVSDRSDTYHTLFFELSDGTIIDAGLRGNAARWINHGCEPNCEAIEFDDGRVFIFATRTTRVGEELLYDYRLEYEGRMSGRARRSFTCRCGARIAAGRCWRGSAPEGPSWIRFDASARAVVATPRTPQPVLHSAVQSTPYRAGAGRSGEYWACVLATLHEPGSESVR